MTVHLTTWQGSSSSELTSHLCLLSITEDKCSAELLRLAYVTKKFKFKHFIIQNVVKLSPWFSWFICIHSLGDFIQCQSCKHQRVEWLKW
jgi:hypothetical protein